MFWVIISILVLVAIGLSVVAGAVLGRSPGGRRRQANPRDPMIALKASGALKHRKSNRP